MWSHQPVWAWLANPPQAEQWARAPTGEGALLPGCQHHPRSLAGHTAVTL